MQLASFLIFIKIKSDRTFCLNVKEKGELGKYILSITWILKIISDLTQ